MEEDEKKMSKNLKTTRNPSFPEDSEGVIRRKKRLNKKFDGFRIDFDFSKISVVWSFCSSVALAVGDQSYKTRMVIY